MEFTVNIGMLWFDNDPKTEITGKIEKAACYYKNKYGKSPDLCFVHPTMLASENNQPISNPAKKNKIEVRTSKSVLPNYFWIGVNNQLLES